MSLNMITLCGPLPGGQQLKGHSDVKVTIELFDSPIGGSSLIGILVPHRGIRGLLVEAESLSSTLEEPGIDLYLDFDCWELSNTPHTLDLLADQLAFYSEDPVKPHLRIVAYNLTEDLAVSFRSQVEGHHHHWQSHFAEAASLSLT